MTATDTQLAAQNALIRYVNYLLSECTPDQDALTRTRDELLSTAIRSTGAGRTALYEAWMAVCAALKGCTPVQLPIKPGQRVTIIDCNEEGKIGTIIRPHILSNTVIGYTVEIDGDSRHFFEFMVAVDPFTQADPYRLQVWFAPEEALDKPFRMIRPVMPVRRPVFENDPLYQSPF